MNRTGGFHQVSRIVKTRTPTQAPNETFVAVYLSYLDRLALTTLTAPVSLYSPDPFSIILTPTCGTTLACDPAMSHCEIQSP